MNQRREARIEVNQSVPITLFGEPNVVIPARIKNISGKGLGLELEVPAPPGTALKIDLDDALLLGEVIFCREEKGSYYAGVELAHSLCGLGELSRMLRAFNEALRAEPSRAEHADAAVHAGNQRK